MRLTKTVLAAATAATAATALVAAGAARQVNTHRTLVPIPGVTLTAQAPPTNEARPGENGAARRRTATASPEDEAKVAAVTARILSVSHYLRQPFDDTISSRLLDRFVDALDPQHVYFLESDVAEFEPYRTTLDDATLKKGDISPAKKIFARFLERFDAQVAFVDEALKNETFTFTADDEYAVDRKKEPRPASAEAGRQLWRDRLRYEYLQEKLNKKKPDEIVKTINRRYARLARTLHEYDSDDILELYLTTLAHVYDPHSDYFGKASSENFDIGLRLSLFGVGAQLQSEDGYVKIMALTPGGPALKSKKLKVGDRIVGVAQGTAGGETVDVVDMKIDRVVEMIRGPKGTAVRLTVIPADAPDPSTRRTILLVRDEIKLEDQAAKAQLIELPASGGKPAMRVGLIDLPIFYQDPEKNKSATTDVARLIARLKRERVQGIILDLRRNGGGSLPEAISLGGLFIKRGPIVQVRDPRGRVTVDEDTDAGVAWDGPLVVLTSRFSASASEIVAGALQDYNRALIVGDASSFGKGTVQAVIELAPLMQQQGLGVATNPGSLHLTIQKFYRPGGASTQLKGVSADLVLPSASSALDVGEKSLEYPLLWDTIPAASFQKVNRVRPFLASLKQRSAARIAADRDFVYLRARVAEVQKAVAQKAVSLNEAQRLKERQEAEVRQKARSAELRARPANGERVYPLTLAIVDRPGLPRPLAVVAPAKNPASRFPAAAPSDDPDAPAATDDSTPERDIILDETKRILRDLITLSSPAIAPSVAATAAAAGRR